MTPSVTAPGSGGATAAIGPDPRMAERRRQVAADQRRRWRRRVVTVLVVGSLAGAGWGLLHSPLLDVDDVVVTGATSSVAVEQVLAAAAVQPGDPLLTVDTAAVAERVSAVPWVASVAVERSVAAGTLELVVTPREGVAVVPTPDGRWLVVDDTGQALAESADAAGLPVVGGVALNAPGDRLEPLDRALVEVAALLTPGLATRVAEVRPGAEGDAELVLAEGTVVVLGQPGDLTPAELGLKLRTVRTVLATVDLQCAARIDVRLSDTAVLTRNPTCA